MNFRECISITVVLILVISLLGPIPLTAVAENDGTTEFNRLDIKENDQLFPLTTEGEQVEIEYNADGDVDILSYTIAGFDVESVVINDKEYKHISLDDESNHLEKGKPELPTVNRSMIIPSDREMEATVSAAKYVEYESVSIAPSKGTLLRSKHSDPSEVPYEFGEVYEEDKWYPKDEDIVDLGDPYIIRDFRGQVVELNPFQYHPTEERLRVYTDVEIEVYPVGKAEENVLSRSGLIESIPREFAKIYESRFINYEERLNKLKYDPLEENGDMLVISHDDFSDEMDDFVNWKNQRGIPTELVDLSEVGSTADDISNYIEDYYYNDDHDLTYVLLVGDNDHVPTPTVEGNPSDPSYSFIEGDDYYPDILVGRFSASTEEHVQTQVDRSIFYEQNLNWVGEAMGIASDEGPGYKDMYDYEFMDYLRDRLLDYDYTNVDRFYDGGHGDLSGDPDSTDVSDGIEDGRDLINYCGHGQQTKITTSDFSTSDMAELENINELPFFITVACLTGDFVDSTDPCFGEKWVTATYGGEPTGGIAAFSSSKMQTWEPPMAAQDEMMHLYTQTYNNNVKTTTGGIAFNGCMFMNDEYGSTGETETAAWHLFGDPSLDFGNKLTINWDVDFGSPYSEDSIDSSYGTDPHHGTHIYSKGEEVTVEAWASYPWAFTGWSGDYTGSEKTITITMNEDKELTAHFKYVGDGDYPTGE